MAEQDIQDEMEVKFHYVLPGQLWGRFKAGEVVELTAGQAYGWEGVKLGKGYVTESGAKNAADRGDAPKTAKPRPEGTRDAKPESDAPEESAKEVTNVKQ